MIPCEMKKQLDGKTICEVATYWAEGHQAEVTEAACQVCIGTKQPKTLNRVTVALGLAKLKAVDPAAGEAKVPHSLEYLIDPGAGEALARYVEATKEWIRLGMPTRPDREVLAIVNICKGCSHFDGRKCVICGCHIHDGQGWTNKARRSNEHCPEGKW